MSAPSTLADELLTRSQVVALLAGYGVRPRKSLGQHFLHNPGALRRILNAADLQPEDVVVEVGPGPGLLTRGLLARAGRVIAIEKDERMAGLLQSELGKHPSLMVRVGDMLDHQPENLLSDAAAGKTYKVVSNLPYYVATPILRLFLESRTKPSIMVVLVQREVAESIVARPGGMGILSVAMQLYAAPKIAGLVRPGNFLPPPKVESAILKLTVRDKPLGIEPEETDRFFKVVRAGFSAPRKQIVNSLSHALGLSRDPVVEALSAAGISPERRPQTLSIHEWAALQRALSQAVDEN